MPALPLIAAALSSPPLTRRQATLLAGTLPLAQSPFAATAKEAAQIKAEWTATDGFTDAAFISFDEGAYAAMRDDVRRTPLFEKAIQQRIAEAPPNSLTVLDLGTGPYALLALAAARAGARKVYTIEASAEAAKRARKAISAAKDVPAGVIEVLEGFSTSINLPEKADLLVAEIAGSVASEEGMIATIRDAQQRLVKRPNDPKSYIPYSCQTMGAPASYALHYALGPPQFDWGKLKEPVRLNCRDETLQLLAEPQMLEDIRFSDAALPASGVTAPAGTAPLAWTVDATRVKINELKYYAELQKERVPEAEAGPLAAAVARSFSGIAMWPRLVLDEAGTLIVESRGPRGEHQKSHWQTVLPLMSSRPPSVEPGSSVVRASFRVDVRDGRTTTPLRYMLEGEVV